MTMLVSGTPKLDEPNLYPTDLTPPSSREHWFQLGAPHGIFQLRRIHVFCVQPRLRVNMSLSTSCRYIKSWFSPLSRESLNFCPSAAPPISHWLPGCWAGWIPA